MTDDNSIKEEPKSVAPSVASGNKSVVKTTQPGDKQEADIVPEFQDMPAEEKKQFKSFMAMFQSQVRTSEHPLFSKFTEAHIDKYLDYVQRDDDHDYEMQKTNRLFYLALSSH